MRRLQCNKSTTSRVQLIRRREQSVFIARIRRARASDLAANVTKPSRKSSQSQGSQTVHFAFFFYFFSIIPSAKSSFQSLFQVRGRVEYAKSSQVGKPAIYSVPTLWLKTRHPTTSGAIGQGRRKPSYKIKKNEFLE